LFYQFVLENFQKEYQSFVASQQPVEANEEHSDSQIKELQD